MGTKKTLFRTKVNIALSTIAVLFIASCGSGETSEDELDELYPDELPAEEAMTDDVPAEPAEDPAPVQVAVNEPPANELEAAPGGSADEELMAPAEPISGGGQTVSYTVRSGDTLMKLAFETYGDVNRWREIYNANQSVLSDLNSIPVGANIQIPAPASAPQISRNGQPYEIQLGDTLGTISNSLYGTPAKWRKIWENNRELIKDPNKIYAGFTLYYQMSPEDETEKQRMQGDQPLAASPASQAPGTERAPAANNDVATDPLVGDDELTELE
jgi:nucleoid-associated protein YgaU